jgi:hypothetical protein
MNKIVKHLLSFNLVILFAIDLLLLFALDWIVWGKFIPQAGGLGLLGYIGLFLVLSIIAILLKFIPEPVRMRREVPF